MKIIRNILLALIVLKSFETSAQTSVGLRAGINFGKWDMSAADNSGMVPLKTETGLI